MPISRRLQSKGLKLKIPIRNNNASRPYLSPKASPGSAENLSKGAAGPPSWSPGARTGTKRLISFDASVDCRPVWQIKSQKSPKLDGDIQDYRDIPIHIVEHDASSSKSTSFSGERRVRSLVTDTFPDFSQADRVPLPFCQDTGANVLSGSTPNLAAVSSLLDDPVTSYGYLSNNTTADSNPNQIYKPCTKRPPLYPGGARHPPSSYSRWRAGMPETKGSQQQSTSPSIDAYSSQLLQNCDISNPPSPVFELTPSPETIRNFGFRPEPWRLHRARHLRDWINKDHNCDSTRF